MQKGKYQGGLLVCKGVYCVVYTWPGDKKRLLNKGPGSAPTLTVGPMRDSDIGATLKNMLVSCQSYK